MKEYITVEGKNLRLGYTTGSCAAAASKAAAAMLLSGRRTENIRLVTPGGMKLELEVLDIAIEKDRVSCAVMKDAGDDPDVTDGILVYSEVSLTQEKGILIDGGRGVGRVTKPGLDQAVGEAAINSVPRRMIRESLEEEIVKYGYTGGLRAVITIPGGETLALKTFNPRLGIEGGISVIGTTGIVEPMSEKALLDTIRVELRQKRETGAEYVLLTPGNYGADFIRDSLGLDPENAVQISNFAGDSLDMCVRMGFKGALLVGHIGKLVKLAANMMNTHSRYGDCRMEILASAAASSGASPSSVKYMLDCAACDEAVRIMREEGVDKPSLELVSSRIEMNLKNRVLRASSEDQSFEIGALMFSKEYGILGKTSQAEQLLIKTAEI